MSASVCNYIFTIMEERQIALRGLHVEEGVGVPAANSGSSVKRCLFGKPDSMEIQRKYEEIHKEEMKRQEKKWGFNFETETPTDNSRYQWERVGGPVGSDIPTPCVMPPQLGSSTAPSVDAVSPPVEVEPKETPKPSTSPQPSGSKESGPTKQSLITDFMPQKRHASVPSADSSSKRPKMPPSPPHTAVSSSPATAAGGSGAPAEAT